MRLEYSRDGTIAFRLGADVDEDLVPVDVHDHPVHDVAVLQALVVMAGIVEELLHERGRIELGVISRDGGADRSQPRRHAAAGASAAATATRRPRQRRHPATRSFDR